MDVADDNVVASVADTDDAKEPSWIEAVSDKDSLEECCIAFVQETKDLGGKDNVLAWIDFCQWFRRRNDSVSIKEVHTAIVEASDSQHISKNIVHYNSLLKYLIFPNFWFSYLREWKPLFQRDKMWNYIRATFSSFSQLSRVAGILLKPLISYMKIPSFKTKTSLAISATSTT
jgi:hypothetical protein